MTSMTRNTADLLAGRAVVLVERLGYLMASAPFLVDYLKTGRWPATPFGVFLDAAIGGAILAVALLMGYARRKMDRVDALRKTLHEAIMHDLKNPMTAVMGCLTCLIEDASEVQQRDRLLNLALRGCRAQMTLLETLVDTRRLEQGELAARKLPMKTRELLDSCLGDVRGIAFQSGVKLKAAVAGSIPAELRGDPDLLPRTITNLLHNAVKYTPSGGNVSLNARFERGGLIIEITDTGIGIPPEHIGRLFGKYYRVEGGDQTARRGSGLGLYFCRLVIEAHGGKVGIHSEVGRGTTITFDIPQPSDGAARPLQKTPGRFLARDPAFAIGGLITNAR